MEESRGNTQTHKHTHTCFIVNFQVLPTVNTVQPCLENHLTHRFANKITRVHFFIPSCRVWLECRFTETHLHIKSRLTFPSTSGNSPSLRRGCTSFCELNLPSVSIDINKSIRWLSQAVHLSLTQNCWSVHPVLRCMSLISLILTFQKQRYLCSYHAPSP